MVDAEGPVGDGASHATDLSAVYDLVSRGNANFAAQTLQTAEIAATLVLPPFPPGRQPEVHSGGLLPTRVQPNRRPKCCPSSPPGGLPVVHSWGAPPNAGPAQPATPALSLFPLG